MARLKQDGLQYFSFDTDFFSDKRIKRLHTMYGNGSIVFYIYLLTEIYRNGYYMKWDEDSLYDAMAFNLTEGFIEQVMLFFTKRELIVKIEIEASNGPDTVITSPGIQRRYQKAVKSLKRDVYVDADIWLLEEEETASFIKVIENKVISEKKENKSVKKENKSGKKAANERNDIKENIKNTAYFCAEPEKWDTAPPVISITLNDKTPYPVYQTDIDGWRELYPAVDILQELRKMKGWCDSNPAKRKTKRGISKFINGWLARTQDRGGGRSGCSGRDDAKDVRDTYAEEFERMLNES